MHWTMDIEDPLGITPPPGATHFGHDMVVTPGLNRLSQGYGLTPLYFVAGYGNQASAPLPFTSLRLTGNVSSSDWIKVWVEPAGHMPTPSDRALFSGYGGGVLDLPAPGNYVVVVETVRPTVHWRIDIGAYGH